MSTTTATDTEAEQYLKELAPHLAALPADERADLLEDLAQHLRENLCPEVDDQGRRLTTEYRQDANGAPVINAFPRRQSVTVRPEPGQPPATVPVRPPAVVVPKLAPTTTLPATPSG